MLTAEHHNDAPRARAVRHLRQMIRDGRLPVGDALPPERDLCSTLGVSRASVRWALSMLEDEGVIRSRGPRTRLVAASSNGAGADHRLMNRCLAVIAPQVVLGEHDNPTMGWADRIAYGAFQAATGRGYAALAIGGGSLTEETVNGLLEARPSGVAVPELVDSEEPKVELMERLVRAGIAVAIYSGRPDFGGYDRVTSDHAAGAYDLTRWMIGRGARRIVQFWPEPASEYWFDGRAAGYRRAMLEAQLAPQEPVLYQDLPVDTKLRGGFETMVRYFVGCLLPILSGPEPVDGLLLASDGPACQVAAALRALGKKPNEDVWIGGYDNYFLDMTDRRFEACGVAATIDKQNLRLGQELVSLLLDRIERRLPAEPQRRVVAPRLVEVEAPYRVT